MADFKPIRTNAESLADVPVIDGQIIAVYDTGELYIDITALANNQHLKVTDVIIDTDSAIRSQLSPLTNKLYFATDTHKLLQAVKNGNTYTWTELNSGSGGGGEQTEVKVIADASVSIELNDNKIYCLTNNNITSITLTANANLSYCTICFTAGTNTTFTRPSVSDRCIGYDCLNGNFRPLSGQEYQIAVDKLNNILTFYVLRISR